MRATKDIAIRSEGPDAPTDPASLAAACATIADCAYPEARRNADAFASTLGEAVAKGDISASRAAHLRQGARRILREAWSLGIVAPIARSRAAADRALVRSMPEFDPGKAAATAAGLGRIASSIPPEAGDAIAHVERAARFLGAVVVVMAALDTLDADAARMQRIPEPPRGPVAEAAARRAGRVAAALSCLRSEWSGDLDRLIDAVAIIDPPAIDPVEGYGAFAATAHLLGVAPPRGGGRFDKRGTTWRRRVARALSDDLVDGTVAPVVRRLLRRHPGLAVGPVDHSGTGTSGSFTIRLDRGPQQAELQVRYDVGTRRLDVLARIRLRELMLPDEAEAFDTSLDAGVPATYDGPAHRVMRRAIDDGLSVDAEIADAVTVVVGLPPTAPRCALERLVTIADAEGAAIAIDAVTVGSGDTGTLRALGFEDIAGDGPPALTRSPSGPSPKTR